MLSPEGSPLRALPWGLSPEGSPLRALSWGLSPNDNEVTAGDQLTWWQSHCRPGWWRRRVFWRTVRHVGRCPCIAQWTGWTGGCLADTLGGIGVKFLFNKILLKCKDCLKLSIRYHHLRNFWKINIKIRSLWSLKIQMYLGDGCTYIGPVKATLDHPVLSHNYLTPAWAVHKLIYPPWDRKI